MFLKITKWINTRTYNFNSGISISLIEDIKKQIVYILKNEISQLWEVIASSENYDEVLLYAKEHNLTKEFEDFIAELQDKNIILSDRIKTDYKNKCLVNYMSKKDKNYSYFLKTLDWILYNNDFLSQIFLELNYKCNLNCKHCCNPKDRNQYEIHFEDAKKIVDEAYELGLYNVIITGGECTINKDFLKIAKYIKQKHLDLVIKTNAQALYDDENLFNEIVNLYPSVICISIYSLNPKIQDFITGVKGSLYKSLKVIKKLKENNINVSIVNILLSYNKGEVKPIEKYAKKLDIDFFCDPKFIYNKHNNNLDAMADKKTIKNTYIEKLNLKKLRKKFEKNNKVICNAGSDTLSIAPNLDILPCVYFDYPLGNFKENSLKEIKEKIVPEFKKKIKRCNLKECFKHDYCEYCMYCPAYSIYDRGFMKKAIGLCQDAKAYQEAVMQKNNI